jgi:hypothetical protein
MSGTSVFPQATQAIFGRGTILFCRFFLGAGDIGSDGTTENMGTPAADFGATGFGAADLRVRFGFTISACVGRIDFIAYGGTTDCNSVNEYKCPKRDNLHFGVAIAVNFLADGVLDKLDLILSQASARHSIKYVN